MENIKIKDKGRSEMLQKERNVVASHMGIFNFQQKVALIYYTPPIKQTLRV